ncbi:GNAT family N-acetyltransferase [Blastococcus xanthinilyticus]|uniref:Acetyltransferase (GNAT) family protein n=1 Tax=Blastococcus xanthinilyticus TaxID=1564164 RepID=A0A5S5D4Z8_9ACTN|nr:GNAT family N-acetyltransferase [Blastococcus xanthinilyticus]TYP89749.1 acetyltransferase (GNAT) family protein [Blastococcus xanthinilyticus]
MPPPPGIRPLAPGELTAAQEIERAAGQAFADVGMPEIAADDPLPVGELDRYRRAGLAWVVVDAGSGPVAYLLAEPVDGALHVEQVSVHPAAAGRGVGRALLEHAATHAASAGLAALTLTTFEDVPWNAPYYRRYGFRVLDERDWTPGLRAIREREAAHGLDRWPRVCMRRDLTWTAVSR